MSKISDIRVVATSVSVSIFDVLLNVLVALFTGSTVMLSQALQGLSDLVTGGVLYLGVQRSRKAADERHQFGYGREVFFWVLIAGIMMFIGTGGLSVYLGYRQIVAPDGVAHVAVALLMLAFGLVTNGYAFSLSLKRLREVDKHTSWWQQLLRSSIVETKATLVIDFLGTIAALIGLVALGMFAITGNARLDGIGSVVIGMAMMSGAVLLIRDVRDLIVGRSVEPEVAAQIIQATTSVRGIQAVLDLRTMYLGSAKLLVIIEVHVKDGLHTGQIERVVDRVKDTVHTKIPLVYDIQVEVETPDE